MSASRPSIVGDDSGPMDPYPLRMEGKVIPGFGRGSKELGIPTANLPVDSSITPWITSRTSGVYFGYASLSLPPGHPSLPPSHPADTPVIFPMVMSIGYNPFYKNTVRSAEVHILHSFAEDFYGVWMRLLIVGFIREELDYTTVEALAADIRFDCEVGRKSLKRETWWVRGRDVVGESFEGEGKLDVEWLVEPVPEEKLKEVKKPEDSK